MWACLGWPIRPHSGGRAIAESELAKKGNGGPRRARRWPGRSEQVVLTWRSLPTCFICPYPIYTDEARQNENSRHGDVACTSGHRRQASDIRVVGNRVRARRARSTNRSRLEIQAGTRASQTPGWQLGLRLKRSFAFVESIARPFLEFRNSRFAPLIK